LKSIGTVAALVVLLLLPSPLCGLDIQIRLSSGLWRMQLDEVNTALAGWHEGLKRLAEVDPNLDFISGDPGNLHLGIDFEGELIFSFSRWVKLGLSAGYGYGFLDEKATLLTVNQAGVLYERARPTKVSAYPFLLSGYFNIPLGRKFNAYLRAGAGTILARYVSREAQKKVGDKRFAYAVFDMAKARRLTYLGGLGLSYSFDESLGFFVEAAARSARVGGLTGENQLAQNGALYGYEEISYLTHYWQPKMHVQPEAPAGTRYRKEHEAQVDFSGYSIKIGLILKF
jgi:opacity protein-like surface antigen